MTVVEVILENPAFNYKTECNGTIKEIEAYFKGKIFNFGIDSDKLMRCIDVKTGD